MRVPPLQDLTGGLAERPGSHWKTELAVPISLRSFRRLQPRRGRHAVIANIPAFVEPYSGNNGLMPWWVISSATVACLSVVLVRIIVERRSFQAS